MKVIKVIGPFEATFIVAANMLYNILSSVLFSTYKKCRSNQYISSTRICISITIILCCQSGWHQRTTEKSRLNQSFKTWAESAKENKLYKNRKKHLILFFSGAWPQLTFVPPKGTARPGSGTGHLDHSVLTTF